MCGTSADEIMKAINKIEKKKKYIMITAQKNTTKDIRQEQIKSHSTRLNLKNGKMNDTILIAGIK